MDVIVPDDQLSLAIGRKGQNVRLAVQLTGWQIDIKSESKMQELALWLADAVSAVEGCGEAEADFLLQEGITSLEDLAATDAEMLEQLPGVEAEGAAAIKRRAAELAERKTEAEAAAKLEAEHEAEAARLAEAGPLAAVETGETPVAPTGEETTGADDSA